MLFSALNVCASLKCDKNPSVVIMKCIFLKQHDPPQSYTLSYAWISVHNQRPSYIGHYILGYIYLYMSGYRTGIDEADMKYYCARCCSGCGPL